MKERTRSGSGRRDPAGARTRSGVDTGAADREDAACDPAPPRSAEDALLRARDHGRRALAEASCAARCLLDAASLATTGVPAEGHESLRRAALWLERAAGAAGAAPGGEAARWLDAVAAALDEEIGRWEARSESDPEARAVLRAFLGVRELLWEFGLRRRSPQDSPEARGGAGAAARERPAAAHIQRVPVEG